MKRVIFFLTFLICSSVLFAKEIRVGVLNGPSCIPGVYVLDSEAKHKGFTVTWEKYADAPLLVPKLLKDEIDIGFLPVNVSAKLYNTSNKKIICAGVTGNGNITLITKDKNIKSLSDLKGKTVYVAGQGALPEYMFKYLLEKNNIEVNTKEGVTLDFSIPAGQLAAQLIAGKIEYAVVPEPFSTIGMQKSSDIFRAIDFQNEYKTVTGKQDIYPFTFIVVRKEFAKNNKKILDEFLKEFDKSVVKVVAEPEKAGELAEKLDLGFSKEVVSAAIGRSNYVYIPAKKDINEIEALLELFYENEPSSIGGKLPDRDFYY